MPFLTKCQQDLQDSSSEYDSLPDISIVDVYDLASDIGNEFEKMIQSHGSEHVQGLMPKVVSVLELLERVSQQSEQERQMAEDLRTNISLLEHEKREKAVDRTRYEKEIEQLEEHWKKESCELLSTISRLQEENRKLSVSLKEKEEKRVQLSPVAREPDWEMFERMREANEKQREQLRVVEKELRDKTREVELLQNQVDRLTDSTKDQQRKHRHVSQQMKTLVEERAELQAALQEQTRAVTALNKRLGIAQRDNQDLVQSQNDNSSSLKNKIVMDVNDPNRPRFTVAELKEILYERNELKARVSDLDDELALYRPRAKSPSSATCNPLSRIPTAGDYPTVTDLQISVDTARTEPEHDEEPTVPVEEESDLPVQGPMPYEPDDAPWKRSKKSGIRKLFKKFFLLPTGGLLSPP